MTFARIMCLIELAVTAMARTSGDGVHGHHDLNTRYIDIYTNYPDTDVIINNYRDYYNRRYVYPDSSAIPAATRFSDRGFSRLPDDLDSVKYDDPDVNLQSDYGDFEDYNPKPGSLWDDSRRRFSRPKFKTGRNYSGSDYVSYVQKIPRYGVSSSSQNSSVDEPNQDLGNSIQGLLQKYLAKLYRKRFQAGEKDDKVEILEDASGSADVIENIETLDSSGDDASISAEVLADDDNSSNFYALAESANNKSKLLNPTKLLNLKNSSKFLANKFLSLFTVIKFPNTRCSAVNTLNNYYEGTCYYLTECQALNGTILGTCANGYGVCCVFIGSCGGSSNQNCTYFESPGYPNYYPSNGTILPPPLNNGTINPRLRYQLMMYLARQESTTTSLSCVFEIRKRSRNVRQLRVDFLDLELRGPTNGTCIDERLIISGQNINNMIPILCGYNTGQHIYIDVTDVQGPIQFAILSNTVDRKRFRIRICQLTSCTNPQNCLQYYTGISGTIWSFNYDQATSLARSQPGYFNNLNYAICIRREAGFCSITYTNVANGTAFPFQIINVDDAGQPTVPPGQAGAEIFSCPQDYIVINGIRLCGDRLNDGSLVQDFNQNAPVTDTGAGLFVVPFRTNPFFVGRGFRLFYTQNPCTNF